VHFEPIALADAKAIAGSRFAMRCSVR